MVDWIRVIGSIILVNLVLSGDNALVIGAAAADLPPRTRWLALIAGGGVAIVLRIIFTYFATLLLHLPYLQALGGLVLLIIAARFLLHQRSPHKKQQATTSEVKKQPPAFDSYKTPDLTDPVSPLVAPVPRSFLSALFVILIADVAMSLDNIVAIGALANGNFLYLLIGLLLSIILLLFASALVAELIGRFSWLVYAASFVLAWTASGMIQQDRFLNPLIGDPLWTYILLTLTSVFVLGIALFVFLRKRSLRFSKSKT